jgi:anti-sigma B factor antagonist
MSHSVQEGKGVVTPDGSMTAANSDEFREDFLQWLKANSDVKTIIFDMGQVELMDSAGLGALMSVFKRISENGGDLKLACLRKKPQMVFELTRAHRLFDIYETLQEALQS